jgi:hypothetical protein
MRVFICWEVREMEFWEVESWVGVRRKHSERRFWENDGEFMLVEVSWV